MNGGSEPKRAIAARALLPKGSEATRRRLALVLAHPEASNQQIDLLLSESLTASDDRGLLSLRRYRRPVSS